MKSSNSEPQLDSGQDNERRPEGRGPVFIGYNIRLLPSNLVEVRDRMRAKYFRKH